MHGARIYDDVHVPGHLLQEGHHEMLQALEPQHAIPAHRDTKGLSGDVDLASKHGYDLNRDLHVASNGGIVQLT